jgi:hypothetical protein
LGASIIQWPVLSFAKPAALPLSGDSHDWLGAPVEAPGLPVAAVAVAVLQGAPSGAPGPVTVWSQDSPGTEDSAEEWDYFWPLR